jgi:hypothetical protein
VVNAFRESNLLGFVGGLEASVDLFRFGSTVDWALDSPDVDCLSNFQVTPFRQNLQGDGLVVASFPPSPPRPTSVEPSEIVREAFCQSIGRWEPDARHHRGMEEQSLSSNGAIDPRVSSLGQWDTSLSVEPLTSRARDEVLGMVLLSCEPDNVPSVVSAFPTCEVLQRLISISLTFQKTTTGGVIHVPTFATNEARPETIAAVIMEGAAKSLSWPIQKFGLCLGEILRYHLYKAVQDFHPSPPKD